MTKVAIIIGSLRAASFTRKIALAMAALAPRSLEFKVVEIGDLPLYNEELEANAPPAWAKFRQEMQGVNAVFFATPEYNRSVPGCLKNAIDVGSRPYGKSVWSGKPALVMSNSPGLIGGFGANHHLRQSLVFLDMPVLQQPEAYISGAATLVDDEGKVSKEETAAFFVKIMAAFESWIAKVG